MNRALVAFLGLDRNEAWVQTGYKLGTNSHPLPPSASLPSHRYQHTQTSSSTHTPKHPSSHTRTHGLGFIAWIHVLMSAQQMITDSAKQAAFHPMETRTHTYSLHPPPPPPPPLPHTHTRAQVWFLAWIHVLMFTPFAEVRPMANVALAYFGNSGVGVGGIQRACLGAL